MTHLDEGVLQALLDGELSGDGRHVAERHVDACERCRADMDSLRSASLELGGALAALDRPAPRRREGVTPLRPARAPVRTWGLGRSLPRAAVLVLGFAAAASATIPGSPVRSWLGDLVRPRPQEVALSAPDASSAPAPESRGAVAATAAPEAPAEAGISVLPVQGEVRIEVRDASPELQLRAMLVDQPRAGVFAIGEAASARFTTAPGRIQVEGPGPGELRVELPRGSRSATLTVNGRRYLTKDGARMQAAVPAEHSTEQEILFRVQP